MYYKIKDESISLISLAAVAETENYTDAAGNKRVKNEWTNLCVIRRNNVYGRANTSAQ